MKKILVMLYGVICYVAFFGTILYAIGFFGNFIVPKTIDSKTQAPLFSAILIDASLLLLFALQHSIMMRLSIKNRWMRFIPKSIERSTYVFLASLFLGLMMWQWQPVGGVIWSIEDDAAVTLLYAVYIIGWCFVFASTFLINHFDLFGLRQAWFYFRGESYQDLPLRTTLFYKFVRHPLYMGFLIAFWATPVMTAAHLLFAVLTTGYILTAIRFEEEDLVVNFSEKYREYKKRAPMIVPFFKRKAG